MGVLWTVAVAALLAVPLARVGMYERRHHRAHHAGRPAVELHHEQDFYGSMDLDAERALGTTGWLSAPAEVWDGAPLAETVWADRNAGRFDSALGGPESDHALSGASGPPTLAPSRLADTGEIHAARQAHPHPGGGWLDEQLEELYVWVRHMHQIRETYA